jgi:Flp pilus assembly pilin Flp
MRKSLQRFVQDESGPIKPEHLDELLSGYEKPEDLLGEDGLFKQLKKALLERALGAELTHHLGYEKGDPAGRGSDNHRNGSYPKTVLAEDATAIEYGLIAASIAVVIIAAVQLVGTNLTTVFTSVANALTGA